MFVLIVLEVWERHIITLGCGLLTLVLVFGLGMHSMSAVLETLNLGSFFTSHFWYTAGQSAEASSGINWETIVFVAGMMIMVEGMARVGFFRWLCMRLAKMVKYKVVPLFVTFMVLSGILAMFIDSITVILFLAAVTIELSQLLKFNPVPMILAEVFCANLGGSATLVGIATPTLPPPVAPEVSVFASAEVSVFASAEVSVLLSVAGVVACCPPLDPHPASIVTAMAVARSVLNNFFLIKSNLPCLVCFC